MGEEKKYEFLDHTADVKFLAYGKTLEEAFTNCVLATTEIMTPVSDVKKVIEKKIHVEASKKMTLLYDFFEELIVLLDTEGFLASGVKEISIVEKEVSVGSANSVEESIGVGKGVVGRSGVGGKKLFVLDAVVVGDNGEGYDVSSYIKSPTYSDMFIKEGEDGVVIQVVHDI